MNKDHPFKDPQRNIPEPHIPGPELLGSLLEAAHPDTIFLYGSYASGAVDYVSPSIERVLGYPLEQVLAEGIEFWPQRTHPEDLPGAMAWFVSVFQETQKEEFDQRLLKARPIYYRFLHGNGKWVWMDNMNIILTHNEKRQPELVFSCMRIHAQKERPSGFPEEYGLKNQALLEVTLRKEVMNDISPREREVLRLIADGLSAKEIADALNISEHTVNSHRKKLVAKFGVKNTAELIKEASKMFWLE